jgi:hypothetical protein
VPYSHTCQDQMPGGRSLLSNVPTEGFDEDTLRFPPAECHAALWSDNPSYRYRSIRVIQPPSWVPTRSCEPRSPGKASPIVVAFEVSDGSLLMLRSKVREGVAQS